MQYKKFDILFTIWSTCISASLGVVICAVLAMSSSDRVKYVWVNLWMFRLYIDDTTCLTNPRLFSYKTKNFQLILQKYHIKSYKIWSKQRNSRSQTSADSLEQTPEVLKYFQCCNYLPAQCRANRNMKQQYKNKVSRVLYSWEGWLWCY